jgi:hypothetical protein
VGGSRALAGAPVFLPWRVEEGQVGSFLSFPFSLLLCRQGGAGAGEWGGGGCVRTPPRAGRPGASGPQYILVCGDWLFMIKGRAKGTTFFLRERRGYTTPLPCLIWH